MKLPVGAPLDVREALRELDRRINDVTKQDYDARGHRIQNAGRALVGHDVPNLAQVREEILSASFPTRATEASTASGVPSSVIMRPAGIGYQDSFTNFGGATKYASVDPLDPIVHDGDTSYVTTSAAGVIQAFTIGNPRPAASSVTAVYIKSYARQTTGGAVTYGVFARLDGTNGTQVSHGFNSNYTDFSALLPRPGGGPWTPGDLTNSSLEIGIASDASGVTTRFSSFWILAEFLS